MTDPLGRPAANGPWRVLLVDDEECLLRPMTRYFANLGCRVAAARELEEAEALLEHDEFDLVLLDLALTGYGLQGLELLRSLRRGGSAIRVVVLSGLIEPEVEAEVLRLGADAVLLKPQRLNELGRVAMSLLGGAQ
jgi:two-component system sensor histidine kinase EvgS